MDLLELDKAKREEITARFCLESIQNKKFRKLDSEELGNVFLAILDMKPFNVYLIDDIGRGMYWDFCLALKNKLDVLWQAGSTVLFLSTPFVYRTKDRDAKRNFELYLWLDKVEATEKALNLRKEDELKG
jgi:hypothetical protein